MNHIWLRVTGTEEYNMAETKKYKILIVDDMEMNIKLLEQMLRKEPIYAVTSSALSAIEAVHKAKTDKPDLILLDVVLPDIDGFEVCRQLRVDPETSNIPIIFITASKLETTDVVEGLRVGGTDYVRKPFNKDELLARIRLQLRLKETYDELKNQAIKIAQSEQRYRSAVEDQTEFICRFGRNWELTFVNHACLRHFGTIQLKKFTDLLPPHDVLRLKQSIESLTKDSPVITELLTYYDFDKTTILSHIQWNIRLLWDSVTDEFIEYQAIGQDVTQRVEAEEAYRTLVDHSMHGMAIIQNGRFVYANPMMTTITGYSNTELLQMESNAIKNCIIPSDRNKITEICHLSSHTGLYPVKQDNTQEAAAPNQINTQIQSIRKDGAIVYLEISAFQTFYRRKPCVHLMCKDVTRVVELEKLLGQRDFFYGIIGCSKQMQQIYMLIEHFAQTDQTVLITGETGTGKEKVVEVLHLLSARANGPLIRVNCAALSKHLIESELFGHVKGSFTDAYTDKIGRFQAAEKGTIFLDEISELPIDIQAKLLRVIETKAFEPVGSSKSIYADVRVIAASNSDLKNLIKKGAFRKDLYYRLNILSISLPPLRDRKEDIPLLTQHFMNILIQQTKKTIRGISKEVMNVFLNYSWHGNVRELKNTLEYAFSVCKGDVILLSHLPLEFASYQSKNQPLLPYLSQNNSFSDDRDHILAALNVCKWHISNTAKSLGISRATLYRKMRELNIDKKNRAS